MHCFVCASFRSIQTMIYCLVFYLEMILLHTKKYNNLDQPLQTVQHIQQLSKNMCLQTHIGYIDIDIRIRGFVSPNQLLALSSLGYFHLTGTYLELHQKTSSQPILFRGPTLDVFYQNTLLGINIKGVTSLLQVH